MISLRGTVTKCQYPLWQTSEKGWRTHQLKHCKYNQDEDNSLNTLNDKKLSNLNKLV